MKTLFLLRHAKSDWNDSNLSDFERPLNNRGIHDLPLMAKLLRSYNENIQHLFSSSAARTTATALGYASGLHLNANQISYHKELYHASERDLLHFTNKISDQLDCIGLVGHNPGITDFCNYLGGQAAFMTTCSIAKITLNINTWKEVSFENGKLEYYEYPKKHY